MKIFVSKDGKYWQYGERQVLEQDNGKEYTLTQPKDLFNEDTYGVKRAIACQNVPANVVPEENFYVYEFTYMPDGYCCHEIIVDESTAQDVISQYLPAFLCGKACECIKQYFES